jgi:hypothetical protein
MQTATLDQCQLSNLTLRELMLATKSTPELVNLVAKSWMIPTSAAQLSVDFDVKRNETHPPNPQCYLIAAGWEKYCGPQPESVKGVA